MKQTNTNLQLPKLTQAHLLRDRVYRVIKDAIVSGNFPPGSELTEQFLSENLGISKTPVRDALRQLHNENFVIIEPFKGVTVTRLDTEEMSEMLDFRVLMEPWAAKTALARFTNEEVVQVCDIIERERKAYENGDLAERAIKHKEFHLAFIKKLNNRYISQVFENISEHIERLVILTMDKNRGFSFRQEYDGFITALVNRDGDALETAMRKHIDKAVERLAIYANGSTKPKQA